MKLIDSMPFAADLFAPLHREVYARPGAEATAGEVTIDESWTITAVSDETAITSAADYLRGNLLHSLGASLGGESAPHRVLLKVDPSVGDHREDHRIRCAGDGIEILGAGAAGVLHGAFALVQIMRERGGPFAPVGELRRSPLFQHRIHRSPLSPFYVEELSGYVGPPFESKWNAVTCDYPAWIQEDAGPDQFYHDNLILRLAEHGFNGFWIRGALRHFAQCQPFPEFGPNAEAILAELSRLCRRADAYGMRVFLYLNEPMGLDVGDPFWDRYPQCQGQICSIKPIHYLCSSTPEVQDYLRQSLQYVFEQVPELAGVMLITASEYPSHCWSHQSMPTSAEQLAELKTAGKICPRCADRRPQEVIGEIVRLIRDGAKAAKPSAEVIAWNWSWNKYEPDPQSGVLEALPDDVILMGDYERGEPTRALDFDYQNDEYSLKVVGPSPRFRGVAAFQQARGMPVYAKLQIGTTHENPTVPYLPVMHKIADKYRSLVDSGVTGMMTCWNFGNMPSLGTALAGEMSWSPQPEPEAALLRLATREFGPAAAAEVVEGWRRLSAAHDDFPGSIPVMYWGSFSRGPAFPFVFDQIDRKFPRSWMCDEVTEADQLTWCQPFGAVKVAECLRASAASWDLGVETLARARAQTKGADRERLTREIGVARSHRLQLLSVANVIEFLLARDAWYESDDPAVKADRLADVEAILTAERELAKELLPLCDADPRLGWHGEGYGYLFNRELLERKLAQLETLLGERLPALR